MQANKINKNLARDGAFGDSKNNAFGIFDGDLQFKSVQHQKNFERGVPERA